LSETRGERRKGKRSKARKQKIGQRAGWGVEPQRPRRGSKVAREEGVVKPLKLKTIPQNSIKKEYPHKRKNISVPQRGK